MLGGAALTRAFVEQDQGDMFDGDVRYAKDAFEGLALMDTVMAIRRGDSEAVLPEPRRRRVKRQSKAAEAELAAELPARSDVADDNEVPVPPFWGTRIVRGVAMVH